MPRKKTNRSELVRKCLAMGLTQNKEIHAVLRGQGKTVTDALIYQIKYAAKKADDGSAKKPSRKGGAKATPPVVQHELPAKRGPKPGFKRGPKPMAAAVSGNEVQAVMADVILRFGFAGVREALRTVEARVRQVA
jgi:LPS O-antigen subunit length determinant protein (WzzB/FepE family)